MTDTLTAWQDLSLPPVKGGWYAVLRRQGDSGPFILGADEWRGNRWRDGHAVTHRSPEPFDTEAKAIRWAYGHDPNGGAA